MADPKPRTHTAYSMQRFGKKYGPFREVGDGRIDEDGVHLYLDRTMIGWTGYVRLVPKGTSPGALKLIEPQRPGSEAEDIE